MTYLLKLFFGLVILSYLNACSTQLEDRASLDFESEQPVELAELNNVDKTGSIYNDDKGGLFATDRRASKVGDILTVALSEKFTASKSQSANSAKTDAYDITLPKVLVGSNTAGLFTTGTNQAFTGSGTASQSNSLMESFQ